MSQRIPEGILRSFVEKVFERRGIPDQDARTAADVIIAANLLGVDTHGVVRLSHYVRRLENGTIKAEPNITVERPAKAVGIVDGDNGLDLWTIQSVTDGGGKGDTVIAKVPFQRR